MSIIKAVKSFVASCPFLEDFMPGIKPLLLIDSTKSSRVNYGLSSNGESAPLESYYDGSQLRQHNFSLFIRGYTDTDNARLENTEFLEHFTGWLREKTLEGELPQLDTGMEAEAMEANGGAIFDIDKDGKQAIYQIPFSLIYSKGGAENEFEIS